MTAATWCPEVLRPESFLTRAQSMREEPPPTSAVTACKLLAQPRPLVGLDGDPNLHGRELADPLDVGLVHEGDMEDRFQSQL